MHIRRDDIVEVITGEDRGKRGRVLRVDRKNQKLVVEGINKAIKHLRRSRKHPQGGRVEIEMPLHWSNVLLVCPACNRATRTGARYLDDGSKVRYCKKCRADIGQIAPPRKRYAKSEAPAS